MGRSKRIYTEADKAAVYVALTVNDGNIRRTSLNTAVPESTIREWRDAWKNGEPTPDPDLIEGSATEFIEEAEGVRDLALRTLRQQIEKGEVKAAQLVATVGMLEDKIRLGRGLATSRSETVHSLPEPEEYMDALREYLVDALKQHKEREQDILKVGDWNEVHEPTPTTAE